MKQLFTNNGKTTLSTGIDTVATSITVANGSLFPAPAANEYFLITLANTGIIEVVQATARTGNVITIVRAQEGTSATAFTSGSTVEARLTKGTLETFSTAFTPLPSIDNLVAPSLSNAEGYTCSTFDTHGNPVMVVRRNDNEWRFLNYTAVGTIAVDTGTTTTAITATSVPVPLNPAAGAYLAHIDTGTYAGQVRAITQATATTIEWVTPLAGVPANGVLVTIVRANSELITTIINANVEKAPINNPTFTGTVGGITKSMVGLGNVANIDLGNVENVAMSNFWSTGDAKITLKTVADAGWVIANDGTIGNAASGATTRANADTAALYALVWNGVIDTWAPVTGGRGASAAADFAADKPMALPKVLGRALAIAGAGATLTARALGEVLGEETHLLDVTEIPGHTHDSAAGTVGNNTLAAGGVSAPVTGSVTGSTGGGLAHNNMQPTSFFNVMIKL